jgi:2-dehydro-3-deoxygluconokinase
MSSILAIGECMVELSVSKEATIDMSFAGDTYNSLVYGKRWVEELQPYYFTAVGRDRFSLLMQEAWKKNHINDSFVLSSSDKNTGIYAIQNDDNGERYFDYWRSQSAATQLMNLYHQHKSMIEWPKFDLLYFSGITLGILPDESKNQLLDFVYEIRAKGARIAFDPNYRKSLWENKDHAVNWLTKAYNASDIVLVGLQEQQSLMGHNKVKDVLSFCRQGDCTEVIIKADQQGVFGFWEDELVANVPFDPAPEQVDATAAGDSFAGVYLSLRLRGADIESAIQQASNVARFVVQNKGAIINEEVFQKFKKDYMNM